MGLFNRKKKNKPDSPQDIDGTPIEEFNESDFIDETFDNIGDDIDTAFSDASSKHYDTQQGNNENTADVLEPVTPDMFTEIASTKYEQADEDNEYEIDIDTAFDDESVHNDGNYEHVDEINDTLDFDQCSENANTRDHSKTETEQKQEAHQAKAKPLRIDLSGIGNPFSNIKKNVQQTRNEQDDGVAEDAKHEFESDDVIDDASTAQTSDVITSDGTKSETETLIDSKEHHVDQDELRNDDRIIAPDFSDAVVDADTGNESATENDEDNDATLIVAQSHFNLDNAEDTGDVLDSNIDQLLELGIEDDTIDQISENESDDSDSIEDMLDLFSVDNNQEYDIQDYHVNNDTNVSNQSDEEQGNEGTAENSDKQFDAAIKQNKMINENVDEAINDETIEESDDRIADNEDSNDAFDPSMLIGDEELSSREEFTDENVSSSIKSVDKQGQSQKQEDIFEQKQDTIITEPEREKHHGSRTGITWLTDVLSNDDMEETRKEQEHDSQHESPTDSENDEKVDDEAALLLGDNYDTRDKDKEDIEIDSMESLQKKETRESVIEAVDEITKDSDIDLPNFQAAPIPTGIVFGKQKAEQEAQKLANNEPATEEAVENEEPAKDDALEDNDYIENQTIIKQDDTANEESKIIVDNSDENDIDDELPPYDKHIAMILDDDDDPQASKLKYIAEKQRNKEEKESLTLSTSTENKKQEKDDNELIGAELAKTITMPGEKRMRAIAGFFGNMHELERIEISIALTNGKLRPRDIAKLMHVETKLVTTTIKKMLGDGIVSTEKINNMTYYKLNDEIVENVITKIDEFVQKNDVESRLARKAKALPKTKKKQADDEGNEA